MMKPRGSLWHRKHTEKQNQPATRCEEGRNNYAESLCSRNVPASLWRVHHVFRSNVCSWRIIFATSAVQPV